MLKINSTSMIAGVQEITIKLFVWADPHDGEIRYVYGPKGNINFGNQPNRQKLNIDFVCLTKLLPPDDKQDRFELAVLTTSRLDKINALNHNQSMGAHDIVDSSLPKGITKLVFDLKMDNDDMFYIDILVRDLGKSVGVNPPTYRLFSCDPQVENGTKT